jgi:hypothetical protein
MNFEKIAADPNFLLGRSLAQMDAAPAHDEPMRVTNPSSLTEAKERCQERITAELTKYGFSWNDLITSTQLNPGLKAKLSKAWEDCYHREGSKPKLPDPADYSEFREYRRLVERMGVVSDRLAKEKEKKGVK